MSENRQEKNLAALGHGKLYRALSTAAYVGVFAAVGILVVTLTSSLKIDNAYVWGAIANVAFLSIGIISALPWIRRIENREYKVASIVFASFIAACVVLWSICLWIVVNMVAQHDLSSLDWFLQFLRIAIIVSLQLIVSTFVGNVLIKCGKTMIILQIISYLSYLFVDFYLSFVAFCIVIDPGSSNPIRINDSIGFLGKPAMITIFALALVYTFIAKFIMRSIEGRRVRAMTEEMLLKSNKEPQQQPAVQIQVVGAAPASEAPAKKADDESVESKLSKLKELYDKQLITESDYNQKREQILKEL